MTIRNIVPQVAGEAAIGTALKPWGEGHFNTLFGDGNNLTNAKPLRWSVPNRFNADHTNWKIGDIVTQTGDTSGATIVLGFPNDIVNGDDPTVRLTFYDSVGNFYDIATYLGGLTTSADCAGTVYSNLVNNLSGQFSINFLQVTQIELTGVLGASYNSVAVSTNSGTGTQYIELLSFTDTNNGLPPGDFIVTNVDNLGDATGYQAIGDTVDFLSGYGAPTISTVAEPGNGYVDLNTGDFYHLDEINGWQFVLNIKGPQGQRGIQGIQGPQGIQGIAGAQGSSFTWKGVYSAATTYYKNDVINYENSSWLCVTTNSNGIVGTPPGYLQSSKWALMGGGFSFQGAWSGSNTYKFGDVVSYNGGSYVWYDTTFGTVSGSGTPPGTGNWLQMSAAGANGATGATGRVGGLPSPYYAQKQGTTYLNKNLPGSTNWSCIVWAAELGIFLAISYASSSAATSTDGTNWVTRNLPNVANNSIAWSPQLGLFCVPRLGATSLYTSPDGINWAEHAIGANTATFSAVTWSPDLNLFVGVSYDQATIWSSTDGITWTVRTTATYNWTSVSWAPELGIFCAIAANTLGYTATSPDGITWTNQTYALPTVTDGGTWHQVIWIPELATFYATATGRVATAGYSTGTYATSPDGLTWTKKVYNNSSNYQNLCWAPELGLMMWIEYQMSACVTSTDGISWTPRTITSGNWTSAAWSPELGIFCMVGYGNSTCVISTYPKKWVTNGAIYTPTATSVANVTASTVAKCRWSRTGSIVYVEGSIQIQATTTATLTTLRLSLPTPSIFTATTDLSGTSAGAPANHAGVISADTATGTALISYTPTATTNQTIGFEFCYSVKPY